MFIYFIFFLVGFSLSSLSIVYKKHDNTFAFFLFIISILFIAARWNVGADFIQYNNIYYYHDEYRFEYGFNIIFKIFNTIGISYAWVSFFISLLTFLLFTISIRHWKYKTVGLLFFILYFIVPLTSTIRQGLSLPFYIFAIYNLTKFSKYYIFTILGSLFHISNLIMVPLWFIRNIKITRATAIFILLLSCAVGYVGIIEYIVIILKQISFLGNGITKLITYSTRYNSPMSIISQLYRLGALVFIFIYWKSISSNKELNFCKNIYIFIFMLTLIFKDNGVLINRLSFSTNVSFLYIASHFYLYNKNNIKKLIIYLLLAIYFSVNYFKFISMDLRNNIESAYLPYKNFIIENYAR